MKLFEIVDILDASVLTGKDQMDREFFTAGASDLMSDILAKLADDCVFLTGLTTVQAIRTAAVSGVGAVVFVRNKIPPPEVIEMARDEDISLLSTAYSMFVSCGRLHAHGMTGLDGTR
ncbi:DRTGG domain-containing protein [Desulfonema magnum]|uniref:DRTGG domain-containing protein n=1 Tax=Desulfonema magnum TaxID=45655 RepID=A0A975GMW9_9BACT|nr:DRTGG domain-containing protein [Desulfonema magnum]QTA87162.1 DRTGG domain-containing protein [Desulfonema magnum]